MSIVLTKKPSEFGRAFDLNSLYYEIYSDQWQQPNFMFKVDLTLYNHDETTVSNIISKKVYPDSLGTAYLNPGDIFNKYLSPSNSIYDFDPSITYITECINSCKKFNIVVHESYGVPPMLKSVTYDTIVLYNGCQQFISYDSSIGGGNNQWLMVTGTTSGSTTGQTGHFLTDATLAYLDNSDYYFLYFLNPSGQHIDTIEYQFKYTTPGNTASANIINTGKENSVQSLINNNVNNISIQKAATTPPSYSGPISTLIIEESVSGLSSKGNMFYIPVGPKTLLNKFIILSGITDSWISYSINLYCNGKQYYPLNANSFYVLKTCRDRRYTNYKLAWLNNHGGYDYFVFDKGSFIKEKDKKNTFSKDLRPGYNFNESGLVVYSTEPDQEITLTTSIIETQEQIQLLVGLFHAYNTFMIQTFVDQNGIEHPIAVNYIITDTDFNYDQLINGDTTVSLTLTPGNKIIRQRP